MVSFCNPLFVVLLLSLIAATDAVCYYPNGNVSPQDTPCQDTTAHSTCCGQGYACLSNRICMATGDELQKPGASLYVRGACTDPTWRSSECPNFCVNPDPPFRDNVAGGHGIAKCPGTKDIYRCIDGAASDCGTQQNVLVFQGEHRQQHGITSVQS
jgi:hypothetical protein